MGFISDQELEEVRSRSNILEVVGERVTLKKAGRHWKGLCPFHQEKSPSFTVNPEKQIYHCFGCAQGGDAFSFLMKVDGLDFQEAVRHLAERYGVTIQEKKREDESSTPKSEKEILFRINKLAGYFYQKVLKESSVAQKGRDYLAQRNIRMEMIEEEFLGFAPSEGKSLVTFLQKKGAPLDLAEKLGLVRRSSRGDYYDFFRERLLFGVMSPAVGVGDAKYLGFSGRVLEKEAQPKYLNSPESPIYHKSESLLGFAVAREAIRQKDQVLLVEGNFDMLRLHQEGLKHTVAPLGTALTDGQIRLLKRLTSNFVLIFDGDAAGLKASERSLPIFLPMGLNPRVVLLPQGEDPDTLVREKGAKALEELIDKAPPLLDVCFDLILSRETDKRDANHGSAAGSVSGFEGKARAIQEVMSLVRLLPGELERDLCLQNLTQHFGFEEAHLRKALASPKPGTGKSEINSNKYQTGSNFLKQAGDDSSNSLRRSAASGEVGSVIERTLLSLVLSGYVSPEVLFKDIDAEDFSNRLLGRLWMLLRAHWENERDLDLGAIIAHLPALISGSSEAGDQSSDQEMMKALITSLGTIENQMFGSEKETQEKAAQDCLKQLKIGKYRYRLRELSQSIRKAELIQDKESLESLLIQKNQLIQDMNRYKSVH